MGQPRLIENYWYTIREAAVFLPVTAETIAKYCRNEEFRPKPSKARKRGSPKKWYILGSAIKRMQGEFE